MNLYQRYRPTKLEDVLGQEHVVGPLQKMLSRDNVPHFLLLSGSKGVGKTSVARVLKKELGCHDTDFVEVNAGTDGGVDFVRGVKSHMRLCPLGGDCRIWLVDEAHMLTKPCQQGFLKETEDTPKHVYFIFATSEPDGLIPALRDRATTFAFKPLGQDDLCELLRTVLAGEDAEVSKKVLEQIAEGADGSGRQALVMLEQALACEKESQQLEAVSRSTPHAERDNFCKILLSGTWDKAREAIKNSEADPEGVRRGVLAYMSKGLLEGWIKPAERQKAAKALNLYQYLFTNGKPDLVRATWEFFNL